LTMSYYTDGWHFVAQDGILRRANCQFAQQESPRLMTVHTVMLM
jgi:hypothetical protein